MDFLKWYRQIIESAGEEPPAEVWEQIQNELDVDAVWTGISRELGQNARKKILYRLSAAASLLLLITSGIFYYIVPGGWGQQDYTIQNKNVQELITLYPERVTKPVNAHLAKISEIPDLRYSERVSNTTDSSISSSYDRPDIALEPLSALLYMPELNERGIPLINRKTYPEGRQEDSQPDHNSTAGYYAGLSGHLGNTWLLNNKTIQGLKSDELTASLPSFGYSIGIITGKSINNRLDIQAEGYFVNRTGQNYNEYIHGHYIRNKLQFTYSSITLSGRWHFKNEFSRGHSLLFGAYAGILRNAFQDIDGDSFSLNDEYKRADYGIVAGYEYFYPLGSRLELGTGFQTRIGLNNIFSGNEVIPDFLNNTRNASINLILSLRYNLK